jgi:hypothetical protein
MRENFAVFGISNDCRQRPRDQPRTDRGDSFGQVAKVVAYVKKKKEKREERSINKPVPRC